jgi:hypothetical protein
MGFFDGFSRRVEADSAALQKRDCKADFWVRKAALHRRRPRRAVRAGRKWQSAGDLLERRWQRFGIFAGGALVALVRFVQFG